MQRTRRIPSIHLMLAAVLAPIVCLALSACGQTSVQNGSASADAPVDDYVASIFYYDYDDVYISSVRNALSSSLASKRITYQEYDADHDQITQNGQIDKAVANGTSILVVNIVNSGSAERADVICQQAAAADIPVIFFNRPIEEDGYEGVILNYYDNVAFVGSDSAEAGHLQGQMIGEYLTKHYDEVDLNGDGRISYAMFKGEAANAEAIYRTTYSVEDANAILNSAGYPDLVYFDPSSVDKFQLDLTGSWTKESVVSYMTTDLVHYNEENGDMIELVIANSDAMAEGAIEALQTFGYNTGAPGSKTIPVFGVDASATGRELIAKGIMTGTISQDAQAMADCIAKMVENDKNGKDLLDGMDSYPRDTEFKRDRMIILPHSIYSPQEDSAKDNSSAQDNSTNKDNSTKK